MFGLYRMSCGAEIVKSFFDYETSTIGPYHVPIKLPYIRSACNGNRFYPYKYYTALLQDENAIAVFNVNNYCLCVVTRDYAYETDLNPNSKLELLEWYFDKSIESHYYDHVGYVRSYADCIAVFQKPIFLIRAANEKKAYGFEDAFEGKPMVNPPLALYKQLVNNEAKAVYFDTETQQPKFLFK